MGVGNGPSRVAEQGQVRGQQYRTTLPAFCAQLVIAPPSPLARLSSYCAICPFLWQRHTPHLKGLWLPQARDINDPGRGLERFHFRLTEVASLEARVSLLEIDPLLQKECNFRKKKCPVQFSNLQSANLPAYSRAQSGFSEFLGWKGGGMDGR